MGYQPRKGMGFLEECKDINKTVFTILGNYDIDYRCVSGSGVIDDTGNYEVKMMHFRDYKEFDEYARMHAGKKMYINRAQILSFPQFAFGSTVHAMP